MGSIRMYINEIGIRELVGSPTLGIGKLTQFAQYAQSKGVTDADEIPSIWWERSPTSKHQKKNSILTLASGYTTMPATRLGVPTAT